MVGDLKYGRTVHSLIKLLALYKGVKFSLVSPRGLEMPSYIIEQASRNGNVIEQKSSLGEGLAGADVIYATRVQKERFANEENEGYTPDFQINRAIIDEYCGPDTIVMHPLPRDSRPGANDLSVDLNHDPRRRSSARPTTASPSAWRSSRCCWAWKGWCSIRCAT